MRRLRSPLLCLAVWLTASSLSAQEPSAALLQEMQSLRGRVVTSPDDIRQVSATLSKFSWELLNLASREKSDRDALARIRLEFESTDRTTAARVNRGVIVLSAGPLFDLMSAAAVLGHDIYVASGHEMPVSSSLAYRPLAASAILPLADPLAAWVEHGAIYTMCPPDVVACAVPQGAAMLVGILAFVLAHEAAHILLGHDEGRPTMDQEIAADAAAARRLTDILAVLDKDGQATEGVRQAVRAAPPLMMMFLKSRRLSIDWAGTDDPLVREYEQRRLRLLERMSSDERADVDELLDPRAMSGGLGTIVLRSNERPQLLNLDGASFAHTELFGSPIAVRAGRHVIFARAGNKLAYRVVYVDIGDSREVVLDFRDPVCGQDQGAIDQLVRKRAWFEVLLALGGLSCGFERSNGISVYEALQRLDLGFLIPEAPSNLPSDREITLVDRWKRRALPLAAWR